VTVATTALLAAELTHKTLWNPTILGILVVLSAIGLFCGSVYLLLATNLGARLGFLVASASLFGFLVLLSILWMTTQTPLNSPKGLEGKWVAKEVVTDPSDAKVNEVDNIAKEGEKIPTEDLATVRPFIDEALISPAPGAVDAHGEPVEAGPFAKYESGGFLVGEKDLPAYEIGGGSRNIFFHKPRYAAVQFCDVKDTGEPELGTVPPTPTCDPLVPKQWIILERDLGSIRQPPVFYFFGFLFLFGLSLLGLHWYEKDHRERQAGALTPVTTS
jgi:hypothetical protein